VRSGHGIAIRANSGRASASRLAVKQREALVEKNPETARGAQKVRMGRSAPWRHSIGLDEPGRMRAPARPWKLFEGEVLSQDARRPLSWMAFHRSPGCPVGRSQADPGWGRAAGRIDHCDSQGSSELAKDCRPGSGSGRQDSRAGGGPAVTEVNFVEEQAIPAPRAACDRRRKWPADRGSW